MNMHYRFNSAENESLDVFKMHMRLAFICIYNLKSLISRFSGCI
jgi:hypothetical protein